MKRSPVQPDHIQLDWLGGIGATRLKKTSPRANRKRTVTRGAQYQLPVRDRVYLPIAGLPPGGRDECRTGPRPCAYVRCKWHLFRIDAEDRAGRPGIANVPRGEHGWTQAVQGDLGQGAGTTLNAGWLELERVCKAWIEVDEDGRLAAINVNEEQWDAMRLHPGERLRVVSSDEAWATPAHVTKDGAIALDMMPPFMTVAVTIKRLRGVPSCALDLIEQGRRMTNEEIGDALGRHRTLIARTVKSGVRKMRQAGVSVEEMLNVIGDEE